ncbi:MAG: hypothetical protein LBF58_04975 [Deltaproteobacteria bacterium]|nr:hypothetical protein [Deltaproteobacteria bacterium]
MIVKLFCSFFIAFFLLAQAGQIKAEYTEKNIGDWFALFDDGNPGVPATAFVAKSSFSSHMTKVTLDSATVHVGCQGGKNFTFFAFDTPLSSEKGKKFNVQYQYDEGKMKNGKWNLTANSQSLMVPNPESFIKDLLKARLLLVKVEKADSSEAIESYFNVSDLPESFKFVRENCAWK